MADPVGSVDGDLVTDPATPVPSPMSDPEFVAGLRPIPSRTAADAPTWEASDLSGVRHDGSVATIELAGIERPLLLVFLSLRCDGCETFWEGMSDAEDPVLAEVTPVVVTKGPGTVDAVEVGLLAHRLGGTPVVMSDRAWTDYRVTGYPFLVLVEPGSRRILAEAVGFGWTDVDSMVRVGLGRAGQ